MKAFKKSENLINGATYVADANLIAALADTEPSQANKVQLGDDILFLNFGSVQWEKGSFDSFYYFLTKDGSQVKALTRSDSPRTPRIGQDKLNQLKLADIAFPDDFPPEKKHLIRWLYEVDYADKIQVINQLLIEPDEVTLQHIWHTVDYESVWPNGWQVGEDFFPIQSVLANCAPQAIRKLEDLLRQKKIRNITRMRAVLAKLGSLFFLDEIKKELSQDEKSADSKAEHLQQIRHAITEIETIGKSELIPLLEPFANHANTSVKMAATWAIEKMRKNC